MSQRNKKHRIKAACMIFTQVLGVAGSPTACGVIQLTLQCRTMQAPSKCIICSFYYLDGRWWILSIHKRGLAFLFKPPWILTIFLQYLGISWAWLLHCLAGKTIWGLEGDIYKVKFPNKRLTEHKFHKSAFVQYQANTRALRKPEASYSFWERSQSSRTHVQVVVLQKLAFWKAESHLTSKFSSWSPGPDESCCVLCSWYNDLYVGDNILKMDDFT